MDYQKYLNYLETTFENSFTFSKEVALKRDNSLISGFIYKAEEELEFNDFYSFGNENLLKYSGVLAGLEEKNYPFFKEMPMEFAWKMHNIDKATQQLLHSYDEHMLIFDKFKLGAEYCLYLYVDDMLRYEKLDTRLAYQNILKKANSVASKNLTDIDKNLELKKIVEHGEELIHEINMLDKKLDSPYFLKKNAFYSVKNFLWLHDKGTFDDMTLTEVKHFYNQKVREEIKKKRRLIESEFQPGDVKRFVVA